MITFIFVLHLLDQGVLPTPVYLIEHVFIEKAASSYSLSCVKQRISMFSYPKNYAVVCDIILEEDVKFKVLFTFNNC